MQEPEKKLSIWRRNDILFLSCLLFMFIIFLKPAIEDSKKQFRDDSRINVMAQEKSILERYYNSHNSFPVINKKIPYSCYPSADIATDKGWQEITKETVQFDHKFATKFIYCPTKISGTKEEPSVQDFFIETTIERNKREVASFDFEKGHNYRFRIYRDNNLTIYRICGGEEKSCDTTQTALSNYEKISKENE